jgi:hypothetical protein
VLLNEFWGDCWLGSRHLADHRQIYVNKSAGPLNQSNENFHQIARFWKRPTGPRTTNFGYQKKEGGTMVKKPILALACALIASPAFAQTTSERGRYYHTAPAMTTSERVIVTAPIIQAREGSAATYQPAGTLVVRMDSASSERFDSYGPGLVYDKLGRPVRGPIKPGARVVVFYANMGDNTRLVDHVVVLE